MSGYPTDDVRLMTRAGVEAEERVYRPGFRHSKAEVLSFNLCRKGEYTEDLWASWMPSMAGGVRGRCVLRVCRPTRIGACVER